MSTPPEDEDVPSPIDLCDASDAREWAETALVKRPWRTQFFESFSDELRALDASNLDVLELGSGPGFLAEYLLARHSEIARYTLLDFSPPMLAMARERLGASRHRVDEVLADFKSDAEWPRLLPSRPNVIMSMQAVHELRHKRHARRLYEQLFAILPDAGTLLVCDHLSRSGDPRSELLFMNEEEQVAALRSAGFVDVEVRRVLSGMALGAIARVTGPRNSETCSPPEVRKA